MLCCVVLCCAVLCCAVLCCAVCCYHELCDPFREFLSFVDSVESRISEDHQSVVRFGSNDSAHTLGGLSKGIEGEEVGLTELEVRPQVLEAAPQHSTQSVLEGNTKDDDTATKVTVEVDSLCHLPPGD